jgi:hypothetical protein
VLLSALVFPGLGQLARRRYLAGLACAGSSVLLLAVVLRRVWLEAQARLPTDPDELLSRLLDEPGWPVRLASEIQRDNAAFFLGLTIAIVGIWAFSVWDAWRDGDRRP